MVKLVPFAIAGPPVALAYQYIVAPTVAVAPRTTVPVFILEFGVVPVIDGTAFTIIEMALDVAGDADTQYAFEVITQVITSPLVNADEANVVLFVPTFDPFLFH